MEASQQQILATKKRIIRKVDYVAPVVEPWTACTSCIKGFPSKIMIHEDGYNHCPKCHDEHKNSIDAMNAYLNATHECLKCNKVGKWKEVWYDEYLCGVCIHGKCLFCQRGIYGKTHGEELCEPCFDKYKVWNMEQHGEK
tara:strand:- start:102 stop:521 length:420 start_codon:yes stop_codon:yes gene_type:complete